MIRKLTARREPELVWFKSSFSDSSEGDTCVEVADASHAILVRDSKDKAGPRLGFARAAWADFVTHTAAP
ncbi:DUF397 domain-containing protein [Streptomyces sp. NPDC127068]|uniref:DUF397 domain-containing protein n=1 Tax=Streptomyces sp. NPDC127068 TaxID=3347127 RepID=UPI00365EEEE4